MAQTEAVPTPAPVSAPEPAPDVSVVVTVFERGARTSRSSTRRTVAALDGAGRELRADLRRRRLDATARRACSSGCTPPTRASASSASSATSASTRRCTPGLARARGDIVVTMDGDLQNEPEDIPKLVAAVEAGSDVASGRRAGARRRVGPHAALAADQRHAAAPHGRRDLRLRLRVQRLPAQRASSPCSARSAGRSSRRR